MRKKNPFWLLFICSLFVVFLPAGSFGDSAEVLPKGISNLSISSTYYFPIDTEFGPNGDREKIYSNYTGVSVLDVFGIDVGETAVEFDYHYFFVDLSYQYGLSDKISIGLNVPFKRQKTEVGEARIDTSNGDPATLAFIGCSGVPGADDACATEFILDSLETVYGYERLGTWSDNGLGDISAGMRYQYFKNDDWQLAFTGAVTFPTGEVDDPDNLIDLEFGSGTHILNFNFNQDYTGIENLVLNSTFRYEMALPDKVTLRVPDDVDQVITPNKERVDRDIGDTIELEISGNYNLSETWSMGLLYKYGIGMKNEVTGDLGYAYESLEDETDYVEHVYVASISYSTISLFMDNKFAIPMAASLSYRDRFAGENANDSQYIALGLNVYF